MVLLSHFDPLPNESCFLQSCIAASWDRNGPYSRWWWCLRSDLHRNTLRMQKFCGCPKPALPMRFMSTCWSDLLISKCRGNPSLLFKNHLAWFWTGGRGVMLPGSRTTSAGNLQSMAAKHQSMGLCHLCQLCQIDLWMPAALPNEPKSTSFESFEPWNILETNMLTNDCDAGIYKQLQYMQI